MYSFEELQNYLLNCSLSQIYKLASHLFFWGQALIIHVVGVRNIYTVSPRANFNKWNSLFTARFPKLEFPKLLKELSTPTPLAAIIPHKESRSLYLEAITFLIAHDLAIQVHVYMHLLAPHAVCVRACETMGIELVQGPLIISNPLHPTTFESECILLISKSQGIAMESLFLRYSL